MTTENESDNLTKNISDELYEKHSKKMVNEELEEVSSFGNI